MNRLSYRLYRFISWLRYAIPRRFTAAGHLALAGLAMSAALSLDMDRTMAFQALALTLCLIAVSMMTAPFFRARFTVERLLPRFGTVGQPFAYQVTIRNRTAKRFQDLALIEDFADPRPNFREFIEGQRISRRRTFQRARKGFRRWRSLLRLRLTASPPIDYRRAITRPVSVPALAPNHEVQVRAELLPIQRGALRLTAATIARPDLLGLFRGFVRVPLPQTVIILPKRYPLPAIPLPGARQYQRGGMALANAIGESEEFVSLRDYRPGDPLRHVHWRSWARLGRPIVKEFQDEFFVRHALILDTFAEPERADVLEEAISVAASFACTVSTQESLLDLMFVGTQAVCFTTGRGLGQAEQALEILASVSASPEDSFESLRDLVMLHASGICGCICVLLDWDEKRRELVKQLEMAGLPVVVLVVVEPGRVDPLDDVEAGPEHFNVLEVGKVAEGLRSLKGVSP